MILVYVYRTEINNTKPECKVFNVIKSFFFFMGTNHLFNHMSKILRRFGEELYQKEKYCSVFVGVLKPRVAIETLY